MYLFSLWDIIFLANYFYLGSIHLASILQIVLECYRILSIRSIAKLAPSYLCPRIKHLKTHFMVLLLNMSSLCNFLLRIVTPYCQEVGYCI